MHPGEVILHDVLEEIGMSITEAARRLGVSRAAFSRMLHGHARVTPEVAVRLERAGAGNAELWLDMQNAFDLAHLRAKDPPEVEPLQPVA